MRARINSHSDSSSLTPFVETVFLFRDKGMFHLVYNYFYYKKEALFPNRFQSYIKEVPQSDIAQGSVIPFGDGQVLEKIVESDDPRFQDLRSDPIASRFLPLPSHRQEQLPSEHQAQQGLQKMIQWTGTRLPLILHIPSPVSLTSSCFEIPKQGLAHKLLN